MNTKLLTVFSIILFASIVKAYPEGLSEDAKVQELNDQIDAIFANAVPADIDNETSNVFLAIKNEFKDAARNHASEILKKGHNFLENKFIPKTVNNFRKILEKIHGKTHNGIKDGEIATHASLVETITYVFDGVKQFFGDHPLLRDGLTCAVKTILFPLITQAIPVGV